MNQTPPNIEPPGADLFIEAAWLHAREFVATQGYVPNVVILGRYADEQLNLVFPSSQDRADFQRACVAEAASFCADFAAYVSEASLATGAPEPTEIIAVHWREKGQPTRAQFAIFQHEPTPQLGPVSSIPGTQENAFLEAVFGETVN